MSIPLGSNASLKTAATNIYFQPCTTLSDVPKQLFAWPNSEQVWQTDEAEA